MQEWERVRIGIIGPSWWVNYWHLPAIENHPQAVITAVCGERERDAAEVQAKYGASARYYTDRVAMLDSGEVDGVVVCTPNDLHAPASLDALRRGIAVTCEKPIALDASEAREMAETAESKQVPGMANFPYRDNPNVALFRRLVSEGYVGTALHVTGQYHGGYGIGRPPGWRATRERSGAGILGDLGSHLIDLVRYITGDEYAAVCASSLTLLRDGEGQLVAPTRTEDPRVGNRNDDSCAFLAEFQSGMQGILHTSWVAYQGAMAQHQEIELYGTGGRLHFVANFTGTFLRGMRDGEKEWETFPVAGVTTPEGRIREGLEPAEDIFRPGRHTPSNTTYRWIEAIRTGQSEISPSLTDGWQTQKVMDAVIQASAERRWVMVGG